MELKHSDILQTNAVILAGMMLLFAFIFSFEEKSGDFSLQILSFVSKLAISIPAIFFVSSMLYVIKYSTDSTSTNMDKMTDKSLKAMRHGLLVLLTLIFIFVLVHEYVLLAPFLD